MHQLYPLILHISVQQTNIPLVQTSTLVSENKANELEHINSLKVSVVNRQSSELASAQE